MLKQPKHFRGKAAQSINCLAEASGLYLENVEFYRVIKIGLSSSIFSIKKIFRFYTYLQIPKAASIIAAKEPKLFLIALHKESCLHRH